MKLLFDQNLSRRLPQILAAEFSDSAHVVDVGLETATDGAIWTFASDNGFVIVSKDADFQQRSMLYGAPPKVIWLRLGNSSTAAAAKLLRKCRAEMEAFTLDPTTALMVLS